MSVVFLFIAAFSVILVLKSSIVVPQQHAFIIERLGKHFKTANSGFHIIVPFIDLVRFKFSLSEQKAVVGPKSLISKDNSVWSVTGDLWFQIVDPLKAAYGVSDVSTALVHLTETALQREVGTRSGHEIHGGLKFLAGDVVKDISSAANSWGIKLIRFEIGEVKQEKR